MYKQISEAILIKRAAEEGKTVLNSKTKYSKSILPELEVSLGGRMIERSADKVPSRVAIKKGHEEGQGRQGRKEERTKRKLRRAE